jgi:hypothetical protein
VWFGVCIPTTILERPWLVFSKTTRAPKENTPYRSSEKHRYRAPVKTSYRSQLDNWSPENSFLKTTMGITIAEKSESKRYAKSVPFLITGLANSKLFKKV